MSLGKGTAYSTSCKQKLNTKCSTEAELVAIDDAMVKILWTHNFLIGQGINITTATIYTRTIRAPYCTQKTERDPAAGTPSI